MYSLYFKTEDNRAFTFCDLPLTDGVYHQDGATVTLRNHGKYTDVSFSVANTRVMETRHAISTKLRNFNSVIVPDSGREYINLFQTVGLWRKDFEARVNDVKTPLYIFTGQDNCAALAFGVIGKDYERLFHISEPHSERALSLFSRTLAIEITGKIPTEYRADTFTESVYLLDEKEDTGIPWTEVLREFAGVRQAKEQIVLPYNEQSMYPLWCSWTDWDSKDVNDQVVLENVQAGVELGIQNYIIDDGWFGPGLDCSLDTQLTLGDWENDPDKFPDLKAHLADIHRLGGKGIIWCAPHAVGDGAKCRDKRLQYTMKDKNGKPLYTFNGYNPLCLRCKEARQIMVDNCLHLLRDYDTDGAKYDLFNNYPLVECESCDHEHDTESMMVALEKTMKQIWEAVTAEKPDYIVELKQNYGGIQLASYGTMMRAGDTPYCPDGNFYRTAYIQAYTPYAFNDYQSVTDHDSLLTGARMVVKMLSVGAPTYSMNLVTLPDDIKRMLKFLNFWYIDNIVKTRSYQRTALNGSLSIWVAEREDENLYFTVKSARVLNVAAKDFQLLNGSEEESVMLKCSEPVTYALEFYNATGELVGEKTCDLYNGLEVNKNIILVKAKVISGSC